MCPSRDTDSNRFLIFTSLCRYLWSPVLPRDNPKNKFHLYSLKIKRKLKRKIKSQWGLRGRDWGPEAIRLSKADNAYDVQVELEEPRLGCRGSSPGGWFCGYFYCTVCFFGKESLENLDPHLQLASVSSLGNPSPGFRFSTFTKWKSKKFPTLCPQVTETYIQLA